MLKEEWKAIFKHKFFIAVLVVIALIPSIYNYIFLGSMWDPYGRVDHLPVAVVNLDRPSELAGKKLDMGNTLEKQLKASHSLDYHFVSEKTASDGLKNGKYYMKITLPKDFSANTASLMTQHPQEVKLDYQTSRGHNFISSKMSSGAMTELSAEVSQGITKDYTKTIFDKLSTLKKGVQSAASGSEKLAAGAGTAANGSQTLDNNLDKLAASTLTFASGANSLQVGLGQYLNGVAQANQGAQQLQAGTQAFGSGTAQLANGTQTLVNKSQTLVNGSQQFSSATGQLASGAQTLTDKSQAIAGGISQLKTASSAAGQLQSASQQLSSGLDQLTQKTTLSPSQKSQISQLEGGLTQLNTAITSGTATSGAASDIQQKLTSLSNVLSNQLVADQTAAVMKTAAYQSLSASDQAQITGALQSSAQTDLTPLKSDLQAVSQDLTTLQQAQAALASSSQQLLPAASSTLTQLSGGLDTANSALSTQILPGAQKLSAGLDQFNSALGTGISQLQRGFGQFQGGLTQLNSGAQQLSSKSTQLVSGSKEFAGGVAQVNSGSQTLAGKAQTLNDGTAKIASGLAKLQSNSGSLALGDQKLTAGASQLALGSAQLAAGGKSLSSGLSTLQSGTNSLSSGLGTASISLSATRTQPSNATAIAQPLKVSHKDTDKVPLNGMGMTPYMMNVSLWVGGLAGNLVIGAGFSGKKKWKKGREFMLAKIGTNGLLAVLQGFIVCGAVALLGLRPTHWGLTILSSIMIACAYMALNTFVSTLLGKIGSFLMLILLILQLSASAGTYPLQLEPHIFGVISPWLPMTYGVAMLRQTIGLTGNIGSLVAIFAIIIVVFTGGLSLFKKQSKLAVSF